MFTFARFIARHKIGVLALVAIGAFFLQPSNEEQQPVSSNPWAVQASAPAPASALAQAQEPGFVDELMAEASEFLDQNGINAVEDAQEAVGRFDDTASAYANVNQ